MRGVLDKDVLRGYDQLRALVDDDTLLTRTHVRITFTSAKRRKEFLKRLLPDEDVFMLAQKWDYRGDAVHEGQGPDRIAFPDRRLTFEYPVVLPRADIAAVVAALRSTAA